MKDEIQYGFCWYRKEQWERLKEIVADPEDIEDTYAEWETKAEQSLREFRANGLKVRKVDVDTEAMLLWANERNLRLDGAARSMYAAFMLRNLHHL